MKYILIVFLLFTCSLGFADKLENYFEFLLKSDVGTFDFDNYTINGGGKLGAFNYEYGRSVDEKILGGIDVNRFSLGSRDLKLGLLGSESLDYYQSTFQYTKRVDSQNLNIDFSIRKSFGEAYIPSSLFPTGDGGELRVRKEW